MLKRGNLLVVWLVGAFALFVFSSCNQLVNYSNQHSGKVAAITSKRIYGDLTVLDLKTMQLTVMAESDFVNHDPEWFPDGKTIIFSSDTSDDQGLFTSKLLVLNSLTGEMKEIQSTPGLNRQPSVSPDGDWVAFNGATISEEIYVLNLASLSLTNVSNSPARDQSPDWSPDGRQIVFSSNRSGKWQIYIMNKDGTDLGQLTNEEANNKEPAWSPDGNSIVFSSDASGVWGIYIIDINGTAIRQIADTNANSTEPTWSPDGQQVMFVSEKENGFHDLYIYDFATGELLNITERFPYDFISPSWIQ